jgi:hypothetical protein
VIAELGRDAGRSGAPADGGAPEQDQGARPSAGAKGGRARHRGGDDRQVRRTNPAVAAAGRRAQDALRQSDRLEAGVPCKPSSSWSRRSRISRSRRASSRRPRRRSRRSGKPRRRRGQNITALCSMTSARSSRRQPVWRRT